MNATLTGRCPASGCKTGAKGDAETLSSVLAMHLRDVHGFAMSEATQAAGAAVKSGQETAFKVARTELVLAEVFGSASPVQARAVLKGLAGRGLVVRVAEGTSFWGGHGR